MDNYSQRSFHHDYFKPFIYHIIFKKQKEWIDFGELRGKAGIKKGCKGYPYVYLSESGRAIVAGLKEFEEEVKEIQKFHYKIMPDHLHMIIYKKRYTPVHLDDYMDNLKERICNHYNKISGSNFLKDDIFIESYTDKALYDNVDLKNWIEYLDDNPNRRLTIKENPDYFRNIHRLKIGDRYFEAYGNPFLWKNPDKYAVRMRRRFTYDERLSHKQEALFLASKGSVLVSPFKSEFEKEVRDIAELNGFPYILIQYQRFPDKFKPSKHLFELCARGKLLIISLGLDPKMPLTYDICTLMNELAAEIAKGK
ncbi:MAG: hypothetical protein J1F38_09400 [Muribaculaceae bacterium]|nr:hypothetical protein [Muribaculaceae bacterium]